MHQIDIQGEDALIFSGHLRHFCGSVTSIIVPVKSDLTHFNGTTMQPYDFVNNANPRPLLGWHEKYPLGKTYQKYAIVLQREFHRLCSQMK